MPTETVLALTDEIKVPATQFAALDNVDAIPYLRDKGRDQYRAFLAKSTPRAFAVSASGAWSWAEEGDDPAQQALADCQKHSSTPCKLYAVDNNVVWSGVPAATATAAVPAGAATSALTGL